MYISKARNLINILEAMSSRTKRGLKYGAGAIGAAGAGALAHHVYQHGFDQTIQDAKNIFHGRYDVDTDRSPTGPPLGKGTPHWSDPRPAPKGVSPHWSDPRPPTGIPHWSDPR